MTSEVSAGVSDNAMTNRLFKLALVQLAVGADKAANLTRATAKIAEAAGNGAKMIVLPECFNSPYGTEHFGPYSETIPGASTQHLSNAAKEHKVWLIGGSIPERGADDKVYNTAVVFNPSGEQVAKHRKLHLFDIDVPGGIKFKESDTLSPGSTLTTFETPWCTVGLGICYDLRFAELARLYAIKGCSLLVYPGCFNMTTGPAHWSLLGRCTALENQVYTALCSQARDDVSGGYVAYGHSMCTNPWGTVLAEADEKETIVYSDIDLNKLEEIRRSVPIWHQRRTDLYDVVEKK